MITYSFTQLFNIRNLVKSTLVPHVWNRVRQIGINSRRRGVRARRKFRQSKFRQTKINKQNLIYIPRTNIKPNFEIKFGTVNAMSLNNKSLSILDTVLEHKLDILFITETWINDKKADVLGDLNSNGYTFMNFPREERKGGGIGLLFSDYLQINNLNHASLTSFQYLTCTIGSVQHSCTITLLGCYHPPPSKINTASDAVFIDQFGKLLEETIPDAGNLLILGDMNIQVNKPDEVIPHDYLQMIEALDLCQLVTFSTHKSGNTLDHVIKKAHQSCQIQNITKGDLLSDHNYIFGSCLAETSLKQPKTIQYRKIKAIDENSYILDLQDIVKNAPYGDTLDTLVDYHDRMLTSLLDKHAPIRHKQVSEHPTYPWYTPQILEQKRRVRQLQRKAEKYRNIPSCTKAYKSARNLYVRLLQMAKRDSINALIKSFNGDTKKIFNLVNNLTGTKQENPLPAQTNLPDKFASFFLDKITKIRNGLDHIPPYKPQPYSNPITNLTDFNPLTDEDVYNLICRSSGKSCELDPIPGSLFKSTARILVPLIGNIINKSLTTGAFPMAWKRAVVKPLLKKPGLECIFKNYRPVSNLPAVSKLIEKAAIKQIQDHSDRNNTTPIHQSAYRINHSCETALLFLHNEILSSFEKQEITNLCAIDLSAAFDTVDHEIMRSTMEYTFGLSGNTLSWLSSYLAPRSFNVNIGGNISADKPVTFSVPQGSVAGPILFNYYTASLPKCIKHDKVCINGFADDHTLHNSYQAGDISAETDSIKTLEDSLHSINDWMGQNKLHMNPSKTEYISFGSKIMIKKITENSIIVCNDTVIRSSCIKLLGSYLDQSLTMSTHITKKCSLAMWNLSRIRSIKNYMDTDSLKTTVQALCISHIDYCNSLFYGLPTKDVNRLQRVQNSCAKLVLGKTRYDSSTACLKQLHWLPVKFRIKFKILCLMHKVENDSAPVYLKKMVRRRVFQRQTRSATLPGSFYEIPLTDRRTFQARAFSVSGPTEWNDLPVCLRIINDYEQFRKHLKTYLFEQAFT